jgi:hypothetical protein
VYLTSEGFAVWNSFIQHGRNSALDSDRDKFDWTDIDIDLQHMDNKRRDRRIMPFIAGER